jgi:hypothetical protein
LAAQMEMHVEDFGIAAHQIDFKETVLQKACDLHSVAEPSHFCPAPAPAEKKEKFNDFHVFQKIFMFFKYIPVNDHQKVL